ncbi:MAG: hypothetical protein SGILL_006926 [Bacillariaceae sp.]
MFHPVIISTTIDIRSRLDVMAEPEQENVVALANATNTDTAGVPPAKKRKQPAKKKVVKPKVTQKDLKEKVKKATEHEMTILLKSVFEKHPEVIPLFNAFVPAKMEKAKPDDPVFKQCCFCSEMDSSKLRPFVDEIKICCGCDESMRGRGDLTRTDACTWFGFTKTEIKNVPHKVGTHGYYGSTIYLYSITACVKAVKAKYGSMYLFAKSKYSSYGAFLHGKSETSM